MSTINVYNFNEELGEDFPQLSFEERKKVLSSDDFVVISDGQIRSIFHHIDHVIHKRVHKSIFQDLKKCFKLLHKKFSYLKLISNDSNTILTFDVIGTVSNNSEDSEEITYEYWPSFVDYKQYSEEMNDYIKKICETHLVCQDTSSKVGLLVKEGSVFKIKFENVNAEKYSNLIKENYGEEFTVHNEKIVNLMKNENTGLYLFHGEPGTGKTSYIKALTRLVPNKRFVYIPEYMIDHLSTPEMINTLVQHKNNIFILEDSENKLLKRNGNALMSTLLNLTDGILADLLKSQFIITFNCAINDIDSAILRPGRCKYKHEFKKLSLEDTKNLVITLGGDASEIKIPLTLAEVYNLNKNNQVEAKTIKATIGF